MKNIRKGFTLIELLVVVLIIGILASIAIPQYFKVVEKARVAEAMSIISSVKSAQERFLARGGTYTNDFTKLDISYPGMSATKIETKFFKAELSDVASTGDPTYKLTATRITTGSSVAGRFGAYSMSVTVPSSPRVTIASCPGGSGNCDELID